MIHSFSPRHFFLQKIQLDFKGIEIIPTKRVTFGGTEQRKEASAMLSKDVNGLSNFHMTDCRESPPWVELGLATATTASMLNLGNQPGKPPSCLSDRALLPFMS